MSQARGVIDMCYHLKGMPTLLIKKTKAKTTTVDSLRVQAFSHKKKRRRLYLSEAEAAPCMNQWESVKRDFIKVTL